MTRADKIRNMTDEQLAEYISDIARDCESNTACNQACYGCNEMYCEYDKCLEHLKQTNE